MQTASFGIVVAGLPVVFDTGMNSQPCDPANASVAARWSYPLATFPSTVWLFLTGNAPLPAGKVLSLYLAEHRGSEPSSPFLYLGHVGPQCPSGKFIVPSGSFYSQFASGGTFTSTTSVLGFSLEDEVCALQQSASIALPSLAAHDELVMKVGAAITQAFSQTVQQWGNWLQGADPNGSDATIVVPTKAIDKCREATERNIERNSLTFSTFS